MAVDPKYTSTYTGQQVEAAIARALPLDTFAIATDTTISSVTYHILWKVAPTASNTVFGITIHPTTGALYEVKSANNQLSLRKIALRSGSKVTIGNANAGTAKTVIKSFKVGNTAKQAYTASYDSTNFRLVLTSLTPVTEDIRPAEPASSQTQSYYVCDDD